MKQTWQWKPNQTVYHIRYPRMRRRYYGDRYAVLRIVAIVIAILVIAGAIASL
jgi:hypothetical protein